MTTLVVMPRVMSMIKRSANNILVGEPKIRPDGKWQITLSKAAFDALQKHSQAGESLNDVILRLIERQTSSR